MELRKCECGGEGSLEDSSGVELFWFVGCFDCLRSTETFTRQDEAIQAWNEGKVE